jgi:hypothetical protein
MVAVVVDGALHQQWQTYDAFVISTMTWSGAAASANQQC